MAASPRPPRSLLLLGLLLLVGPARGFDIEKHARRRLGEEGGADATDDFGDDPTESETADPPAARVCQCDNCDFSGINFGVEVPAETDGVGSCDSSCDVDCDRTGPELLAGFCVGNRYASYVNCDWSCDAGCDKGCDACPDSPPPPPPAPEPPPPPPYPPGVDPPDDDGGTLAAVLVIAALALCCCFGCFITCRRGWWDRCCKPSGAAGGDSGGFDVGALFGGLLLGSLLTNALGASPAAENGNDVAHLPFLPLTPAARAREGARPGEVDSDQL